MKNLPSRKSPRLKEYDYSSVGAYFITICTHQRKEIFGKVAFDPILGTAKSELTDLGKIAEEELKNIEGHYCNIAIDRYVIMPNHIHLILRIKERINPFPTEKQFDISNIIGKYKAAVTRRMNVGTALMPSAAIPLWQSSFYDHIIRGEQDYKEIAEYIENNPARWSEDRFYQ